MTMTRLPHWTGLGLTAMTTLGACVQTEDLSDPAALMTATDGSSSTGGDDGASSVSATSTTGEGTCATTAVTHTSFELFGGPAASPTLSGFQDIVISDDGSVTVAFIQGDNIWVEVDAEGARSFSGDAPGTVGHVGYFDDASGGRRVVALDFFVGATDWLQMVEADGSVVWNAPQFDNGGPFNTLVDDVVVLADGSSVVHMYWVSGEEQYARLAHFDAAGLELDHYEVTGPGFRGIVQAPSGDVWVGQAAGQDTSLLRFAGGSFAAPAQTLTLTGQWLTSLDVDGEGQLLAVSQDAYVDPATPITTRLQIVDPDDGAIVRAYSSGTTAGFGNVVDAVAGPCGELFVVGGDPATFQAWVAELDAGGVVWSDSLDADSPAVTVKVAEDGTLVVVGQASVYDAGVPITVGPFIARYEP
jgi:hypothetical protein